MKFFRISSAVMVMVLCGMGEGCSWLHHAKATPPPQAQAPAPPTEATQPATPLTAPTPTLPQLGPEPTVVQATTPPPTPKKTHPHKNHKKIVTDNTAGKSAPEAPGTTQTVATNGTSEAAAASPIGQLSAGDSTDNPALRQQTVDLIASTEKQLKTVEGNLAATKHDTIVQIQSFLKQAKQALEINDLAGANTLATKAKILVDELLK